MRLFFLLVFISLSSYSQKIKIENFGVYQNSSLDTLNNAFELYFVDYMLTIDLANFKKKYTDLHYVNKEEREAGRLGSVTLRVQDTLYFITGSGGLVHMIKNDTVRRIDKSFDHQMHHGACWFEHDKTAFTYGGYGFWSNRDFFTYYHPKLDEWEVYHPIKSEKIPKGTTGSLHIKKDNEFHFFGGDIINPKNRRQRIRNNEVWTFNFSTKEWRYLGKHQPVDKFIKKVNYGNSLVLIEENEIISIDVKNNQRTIYQPSPVSAQSKGFRSLHYAHGKFYIVMGNITGVYLNIVDEEDFFGPVISQSKFYKNNTYWVKQILFYGIAIVFIVAIFLITKRRLKKLNRLQILDNGLKYRNKFREFKPESMKILKLLLANKEVPSSEILNIVEKEQYSPAHNERIKVQIIKDINLRIATLLGKDEEVITSYKSKHDRRIRMYTIDDSLF
ncbi:hypothetical protein [Lutimonas zeaxanthinifaciens]|uniref:hypothetical protein n=1 Tax=Lutimonas zeaxanthinifaciens TaxID=3060215 RepID=UPI00265D13A3|nr:hypothetical protein [Lutimonas sp. YSD2104]WKK66456.1 hypothetical protein QZH61_02270 [Lutimonas sp. YSD2104]